MAEETTVSLADIAAKETWTVDDHHQLVELLAGESNATAKFKDVLTRLVTSSPGPKGDAALKIGIAHYMLCRYSAALGVLASATDNKDNSWFQALCLMQLQRYDQAAECLAQAKSGGMPADQVDLKLAEVLVLSGDLDAADKLLASLSAAMDGVAEYHYVRGLSANVAGFGDNAVEAYEHALDIDENCAVATFQLAYYCDLHGDEERAIELYQQCTAQAPVHVNALLNLAVLYDDAGEYDKTIAVVRRVLNNNPNHLRAKLILKDAQSSKEMYYDEEQAKRMAFRSAVLDTPVTDFELSVRARNCLKKMSIRTLGDLVRTSEATLMNYKNFGETSLKEIREMLSAKDLSLGQALDEETSEDAAMMAAVSAVFASPPPEASDEVLATTVASVDFSIRVQRALETMKIVTLGDLVAKTEAALLTCNNFGQTSLNEVHAKLSEQGLKLSEAD